MAPARIRNRGPESDGTEMIGDGLGHDLIGSQALLDFWLPRSESDLASESSRKLLFPRHVITEFPTFRAEWRFFNFKL
jgi:hypothetical protein